MNRSATSDQVRLAGPFQQLVLLALIRLGADTNATFIRRHLQHVTGRRISLTAVHTTLGRLAQRGYCATWRRGPFGKGQWFRDPRPGPRDVPRSIRRFFQATAPGRRALRLTLATVESTLPGLPGFSREDELFSWTRLPDPNPTFDRLVRRVHRHLLPREPGEPDPLELELTARLLHGEQDFGWGV